MKTSLSKVSSVYRLYPLMDVPGHRGFAMDNYSSLKGDISISSDLFPDDFTSGRRWQAPRLAEIWKPRIITDIRPKQKMDYDAIDAGFPLFSDRAVAALRDFLEPSGELLPTICKTGKFFLFNPTIVADVLDREKSVAQWLTTLMDEHGDPILAQYIRHYEFYPGRLSRLFIFRIPEDPCGWLVTDVFVNRVNEHKLNGFNFEKVWPLPIPPGGVEADAARRGQEKLDKEKNSPPSENTVVIRLSVGGPDGKGTKDEQRRIEQIMDELDDFLIDDAFKKPQVADLQGNEYIDGECRLFLTGANADAIVEELRPWLHKLAWPSEVIVLKRYGYMHDDKAPEAYAEL